jgi:predicted AlkP superfamily pyrophosphatase or phosphodiesterase
MKVISLSLLTLLCSSITVYGKKQIYQAPKMALVIVVDQFAYHELQKLSEHLTGGIHFMQENSVSYENAYMPHGMPETSVGHASLDTGALPKDHGIIGNHWYQNGKLIDADEDKPEHAAVFAKDGSLYPYGKSAENIMIDTLSDQVMLRNSPQKKFAAVGLSLKSRAAITLSGHMGMPIWMDSETGWFTTSKAYTKSVPTWVQQFNRKHRVDTWKTVKWDLVHPLNSPAYNYNNINNYTFAGSWGFKGQAERMAGSTIPIENAAKDSNSSDCFECLDKTPMGNTLLTDLALACLDEYADHQKPDHLLLWVSMSGLDKIGHTYGPESLEVIDMLYHIDQDIQRIMNHANKRYGAGNVLFVLTADHGIIPVPELVKQAGYSAARRILTTDLIRNMNLFVEQKFGHKELVIGLTSNNVYLDPKQITEMKPRAKEILLNSLKHFLMRQPGIKRVWTQRDLSDSSYHIPLYELESFCRNQIEPSRSGQLYIQVSPYTLLTDEQFGVTHASPYDYDTHIPLMLYQKGKFQNKQVMEIVWAQQLAPTIAHILNVPRPSAATFNVLPRFFN